MTKEERAAMIKEHGESNLRTVLLPKDDLDSEFLEVTIKVPSRATVSQYMKYSDVNPKKAQEILIKQCLLNHKEEVMQDDHLFLTCVSAIAEILPIREFRIKKF